MAMAGVFGNVSFMPYLPNLIDSPVDIVTACNEFPGVFAYGPVPGTVIILNNADMKLVATGAGSEVYKMMRRRGYYGEMVELIAMKKLADAELDSSSLNRMLGEATLLRQLDHENIIGYRGMLLRSCGDALLFMELADCALNNVIEKHWQNDCVKPLLPRQIMMLVRDMVSGLAYLHMHCLMLHGDIKSSNVVLTDDRSRAKLCDFGLAVPTDSHHMAYNNAAYAGTMNWMAPEVICRGAISDKTDMFSFGLVIWEMLAYHVPHTRSVDTKGGEELHFTANGCIRMKRLPHIRCVKEAYGTRPALPKALRKFYQQHAEYQEPGILMLKCTEIGDKFRPSANEVFLAIKDKKVHSLLNGRPVSDVFQD